MISSIFNLYIMKDIFDSYYLNEIANLKEENEKLKLKNTELNSKLNGVIVAKNEIYSSYIKCILSK